MAASDFVRIEDGDAIPKPHGAEEHRAVRLDSREALDLLFSAKKNGVIFGMCGSKLLRRSAVGALEFDGSMSNADVSDLEAGCEHRCLGCKVVLLQMPPSERIAEA